MIYLILIDLKKTGLITGVLIVSKKNQNLLKFILYNINKAQYSLAACLLEYHVTDSNFVFPTDMAAFHIGLSLDLDFGSSYSIFKVNFVVHQLFKIVNGNCNLEAVATSIKSNVYKMKIGIFKKLLKLTGYLDAIFVTSCIIRATSEIEPRRRHIPA